MPKIVNPLALADKNAGFEGSLPLKEFDRLAGLLFDRDGEVQISLVFSKVGRFAKISGQISANISLKCQRCLEAIEWPIDLEVNLGVVNSVEQANRLPGGVEPLLVNTDKVPLAEIIEDELLLNIPVIPKHDNNCSLLISGHQQSTPEKDVRPASENPFSKLAVLKKTEN